MAPAARTSTSAPAPRGKHRSVFQSLLLAGLLALSAAACGQRGPLYLPTQEPPANVEPAATETPDTTPEEADDPDDETGRD